MGEGLKETLSTAWEIENKSIIAYMGWIKILTDLGIANTKFSDFIVRVIMDSLIHKRIVEAIMQALNDVESVRNELNKRILGTERKVTECDKEFINFLRRMIKEHEKIEKDAAVIYEKLAAVADNGLLRGIFLLIAEDEKRHDEYMTELNKLVEELC